jgi:type II secretory pathway component PulK
MKKNKNEKGFALVLAILLLVVMSVMGATLVAIVSNDFKE